MPDAWLQIGNTRLALRRIGAPRRGSMLVYLHEGLGSIAQWRDFPDKLCASTGLPGLIYDRVGHGESSPFNAPRPPDYLFRESDVLGQVLRQETVDDAILVGHSDGATIALIFASENHWIRGLVAEAPHIDVEETGRRGIRATVARFQAGELDRSLNRHHGEKGRDLFNTWSGAWLSARFTDFSIAGQIANIRCPVLAIQGTTDPYASDRQLAGIAAAVPDARISWIPECGHTPHREAEDHVLELMASFIRELTRADGGS